MSITRRVFWINLLMGAAAAVLLLASFFWIIFDERLERNLLSNRQALEFDLLETRASLDRIQYSLEVVRDSGMADQFLSGAPSVDEATLSAYLRSILGNNASFVQVRVLDAGANEVLRIDRVNGQLVQKTKNSLQNKSGRDYIQQASVLKPGSIIYSDITLNEEFGRVEQPEWPTLRGVLVLGKTKAQGLGYFVINVHMQRVLAKLATSPLAQDARVFDQNGRYIYHSDTQKTFGPQRGVDANMSTDDPALFVQMRQKGQAAAEHAIIVDQAHLYGALTIGSDPNTRFIYVLRMLDKNALVSGVLSSLVDLVWIVMLVFVAIFGIGLTTSIYLQRRFRILNDMIGYFRAGNYVKGRSLVRQIKGEDDEVFESGRAFARLVDDITEKSRAIELANEKTQRILDSIASAIVVTDTRGNILEGNRAAERIFGYEADELRSLNVKHLMPREMAAEHDGHMAHSQLEGESRVLGVRRDLIAVRKDGEHFPIELVITRYRSDDGANFVGVITDVSDLKRTRDDLVHYSEKLRLSNQQLQRYAYALSHDLKAPIRKITMFAQMINPKQLSEEDRHHLSRLQQSSKRATVMIDALMSLASVEAQKSHFAEWDLESALREIIDQVSEQYSDIKLFVQTASLPSLNGDSVLLSLLFENLVRNAFKYGTRDGELHLNISHSNVWPESARAHTKIDRGLCILIEDQGAGVDTADCEQIFDIFYRAKRSDEDIEGTGVGLATCRKIMEVHHGVIFLDPDYTSGARFVLIFPEKS